MKKKTPARPQPAQIEAIRRLIESGRTPEAALQMLAPLLEREEFHITEWRACLGAQMAAAEAMGDEASVRRLSAMLADSEKLLEPS
ncbi:MAG: hypothetical protein KGZ83_13645 [Sulfuricella sp.]|nr:hypothetical protein [Sulfuricella sp.]